MSHAETIAFQLGELTQTDPNDWFIVSRTRHGMEVVLATIKQVMDDGEAVTQPFTCATAVNPILNAGLKPVYCDIKPENLALDTEDLEHKLTTETRCVIVQHTLGLVADVAGVKKALDNLRSSAILLEDSAHCLARIARDNGEPIADVSVHSFGAEKFLPTSFGGAVWLNPNMANKELNKQLRISLGKLPAMGIWAKITFRSYPYLNAVINHLPTPMMGNVRSLLQRLRILITPIMPEELFGRNYGAPSRLSEGLARKVEKYLNQFKVIEQRRTKLSELYSQKLEATGMTFPKAVGLALVRYPLRCKDANQADMLFTDLRTKGYTIGKWYRPLLFPCVESFATYSYTPGSCPIAETESARIINLPTTIGWDKAEKLVNEFYSY